MKTTGMSTFAATAALMVAMTQPGMADGIAASSYVQGGLVACWDGVENAGAGVHNPAATVWKDIVGGYEFALTGVTVDDDRMTFAGDATSYGTLDAAGTTATFGAAMNGTLEIVYVSRNGNVNQILLQAPPGIGMSFGELISDKVHVIIPFTTYDGTAKPAYIFASGTATNSVSMRCESGAAVAAIANGSALSRPANGAYWSGTGTETFVGNRASKAAGFPGSIYCIRLYSRQLTDAEIAFNQYIDRMRFMADADSALLVTGAPDFLGSPSPAYGGSVGLSAGDTREVSCGAAVVTNAAGNAEYRCAGWKLYNGAGAVVDSGSETSFTYTHPTPAVFRRLEWQWEVSKRFTDFSNYVQDGLVAAWDGIGNAGVGVHANDTAVGKDVIGGYEFALTNVTVNVDRMTFAGSTTSYGTLDAAGTAATFDAAKNGTLEIVFASRNLNAQVLLQTPANNGMTFGYSQSAASIVPFSGSETKPLFPVTLRQGEVYSFAVRYSSGAPVSALANGENLNSPGGGYWTPGEGDETFVGNRASKAHGFPGGIYCIRLYNRQLTDAEIIANCAVDAKRFPNVDVPESTLAISGTIDGVGAPVPAYGYLTELSAGDTRVVSCGAASWKDADDTKYSCSGWKLYDGNGAVVGSGSGTSFTYTHPTPAEYRRLEWQWKPFTGVGTVIRLF